MADEVLDGPDVVFQLLKEGEGLPDQPAEALAQGVVESLPLALVFRRVRTPSASPNAHTILLFSLKNALPYLICKLGGKEGLSSL